MSETAMVKKENKEMAETKKTPPLRTPRVTVDQDQANESFTLYIEMPGIGKKDVELSIKENTMTVKGLNDRRFFKRTFTFRKPINPDDVEASMKNGILTVTVKPKEPEAHTIKIK